VTVVSVPETAIDKNHRFVFWQNDVRATGQRFHMQAKPEASGMQRLPDENFRLGILASYCAHIF